MVDACGGRVCSITVVDSVAEQPPSTWIPTYRELVKRLESKYGLPHERVDLIALPCQDPGALSACLSSGTVAYKATWVWERGFGIIIDLANNKNNLPSIFITYSNPASLHRTSVEGL